MAYAVWLADVLRGAGCKVVERPGWQDRGRGPFDRIRGVICHHTAGARTGNAPSLDLVENGRRDLPGPLSQLVLGRDGTFYVVGAGRANHAGRGEWHGITAGNSQTIGIEAENAGTGDDPWPDAQMIAYARGVAAILRHIGADELMCAGHKEYALPRGRKIDPAFDMMDFREAVDRELAQLAGNAPSKPARPIAPADPKRAMLRKGDRGVSVRELQAALKIAPDGSFGPKTEAAVRKFQIEHGLAADGMVGPKTWAALLG